MRKQIIAALILVVCANACKTSKKAIVEAAPPELIKDEAFRKPVVDKILYKATTEVVPIDTVYISKDTLNIVTKKMNGCETDNFKLIWNGDLGTTPVQTTVKLFQLVDPACKERHRFHLFYNISSLKPKTDTATAKTTLIGVGGWRRMSSYNRN